MKKCQLAPAWIDSHCHLASSQFEPQVASVLERCKNHQVQNFLMAGVGPEDWERQKALQARFASSDFGIFPSFGLHPYWVAEHGAADCAAAIAQLERLAPEAFALGEMGLDYRSGIIDKGPGGRAQQREFFQYQLSLAQRFNKLAILHLVRCHDEAIELLRPIASSLRPSMIHSFNAGPREAKKYLDLGFTLSIAASLLREPNIALKEAVQYTPLDRLLLESDSPDQAPPQWQEQYNEPWTILLVAERMAELKGLKKEEVLIATKQNFERLFATELL